MIRLCLVTYLRDDEIFTDDLVKVGNYLNSKFPRFNCFLFSESPIALPNKAVFSIKQIQMPATKYKRIKHLIDFEDADYCLSIDNDIEADLQSLEKFVNHVVGGTYDIGWGKILAKPCTKFIPRLVSIDKILSHYYIRPLLWRFGYGISIPGQYFIIKRNTFKGKLLDVDTYLDDLALGLYVNKQLQGLRVHFCKDIVGYEESNDSFTGLFKQRSRWAHGFLSIINALTCPTEKKLIMIHGASYHSLWIFHWITVFLLAFVSPLSALIYMGGVSLLLTRMKLPLFLHGVSYQLIFPIFHMRWIYCILKGNK